MPDSVTVKESPINGLGLFATERISEGTLIGIIHHVHADSANGVIRTPLGGFGNHSDNPNCFKLLMEDIIWCIGAKIDIMAGEELTWCYTLYGIE